MAFHEKAGRSQVGSWFTPALTFFIAGLLYLLCLEKVDNLGAYTASRPETVFSSHLFSRSYSFATLF